jgi:hypothetical protein
MPRYVYKNILLGIIFLCPFQKTNDWIIHLSSSFQNCHRHQPVKQSTTWSNLSIHSATKNVREWHVYVPELKRPRYIIL